MSNSNHKTLSVIIPVYNEERTVTALLDKVIHADVPVSMEIIVVNDGSTDQSPRLCEEWIRKNRPLTPHSLKLLHRENGGKGAAVKTGISASSGDVVIIQDADLEYDPNDYAACIAPILHGECKVVYGSREENNRNRMFSSPSFFLGGLLLTWWIDLLFNAELTDEPTCYKTFDGPLLRSIPLEGNRFEWEPEITAKLLRMGFEIREVPIDYHPRKISEGKKIKWKDGLLALWIALYWRFASLYRIRRGTAEVSPAFRDVIRKKKISRVCLVGVFVLAFLIRLLGALPGLSNPQLLMRPDSAAFLADAGKGIFTEAPVFHKPYPSAWRVQKPDTPAFRQVYGNETRAPLYVIWLSVIFGISGHNLAFAAMSGCLLGAMSCVVLYLAGHLFGSYKTGLAAALLLALNPTAITYAPLFLPDTLFLLAAALQCWFFLRFIRNAFGLNLIASVILAAFGALIRPANALWIFPCVLALFFFRKTTPRLRLNYMLVSLLLFGAVLLPWLWSSYRAGLGWRIDTISSEALMKNAAALEANVSGRGKADVLADCRAEMYAVYAAEPEKFATLGAQLRERDSRMLQRILQHPFRCIVLHLNPAVLLPETAGMMINLGMLHAPNRTWMQIFAIAVRLLYAAMLLGLVWYFVAAADRRSWFPVLLLLVLSGYYLLMPGSIAEPRYQLPALPFLCLAAGFGLMYFKGIVKEKKTPSWL